MKKIHKYQIPLKNTFSIEIPVASVVVHVRSQHNVPFLWAEVNPENPIEERHFGVYGTGQNIETGSNETCHYIGTFMLNRGDLVFHLYEFNQTDE